MSTIGDGKKTDYDAVIVGGGFYGTSLALHLVRSLGRSVVVLEAGKEPLGRASYRNQARVHRGYHYPRSLLTGLRSRVNYTRFLEDYRDCIDDGFEQYYAVGRRNSKVTAEQFCRFCERIEAPLERAPARIKELFNRDLVEDVYLARECAFDASKLRAKLAKDLAALDIEILMETTAERVREAGGSRLSVECAGKDHRRTLTARRVYNCTYSRTNRLLASSGLPAIPLKHELTEIALVEAPEPLEGIGITIMCGPFFSIMPFPARRLHSFSHVRYTPHFEWHDGYDEEYRDPYALLETVERSNFVRMVKDAERYVPSVADCRQVDSIIEVKTLLPQSEVDDCRPILFKRFTEMPELICILGGKIDNIYEMFEHVERVEGKDGGQ
ncbi:MAG: NAD(P)/FAD-dependent oxidoreductase [Planctomycetota bacterium]